MKRLIAVFVFFAAMTAGAFAQTFDWTASLNTGLFVQFTNREDAGPFVYGASANKAVPLNLELDGYYINANGTAGITAGITLKAEDIVTGVVDQAFDITKVLAIDDVFGWAKLFNGILTLNGGVFESELFETPAALESHLESEGIGLSAVVAPLPARSGHDLKIGLSAFAKAGHTTLLDEGKYIISARYQKENMIMAVANFALRQYGPLQYGDKESTSYNEQKAKDIRINLGANYLGLSSLGFAKLAFDVEARDLGGGRHSKRLWDLPTDPEGGVVYPLYFGETIQWHNDVIDVEGSFKQLIRIGDDHKDYAPSLYFTLKGSYKVNDFVVPKLGIQYIMNSQAWENPTDMRFDEGLEWEDCLKDTGGLGAYVAVEFRIGGGTQHVVELGYSLKADTGKNANPDPRTSTLDQAIYASIKISR
ncbi:hypothetical protein AGMMS49991_03770 [Spirochaetia bacterium]|nr:hypothetical protein AGMMS49991_03770 [Spirochaetia bacterium]